MKFSTDRFAWPALLATASTLFVTGATASPLAQTQPAAPPQAAAAAPDAAASGARAALTAAPAPRPGALPPFAETTRDAKRTAGYMPVWTRDDRTWLEIPADLLDKPLFFGASLASGLGERGFFPGLMGREQVVVFKRVGNSVQLIARNLYARAADGTPLGRAVRESYSDSLLAAAPHPQHKGLLVDAFVRG